MNLKEKTERKPTNQNKTTDDEDSRQKDGLKRLTDKEQKKSSFFSVENIFKPRAKEGRNKFSKRDECS